MNFVGLEVLGVIEVIEAIEVIEVIEGRTQPLALILLGFRCSRQEKEGLAAQVSHHIMSWVNTDHY